MSEKGTDGTSKPDRKRYSPDPSVTIIPDIPIIKFGDNQLNLRELFTQRDQNTGEYAQKYTVRGVGEQLVEASLRINGHLVEICIPAAGGIGRLRAQIGDEGELSFFMTARRKDGMYYQDFPRGSEFFLAAYKFLSEQNTIHVIHTSCLDNNIIRDNYDAFESARTDFLKAYPQYATLCQEIAAEEDQLRKMKLYDANDFMFDDVTLNVLASQDWNDLDERVKSILQSLDRFTYYKFIRTKIAIIEKKVNEAAARETWNEKMAKIIGFTQPHLVKRGPVIFDRNGSEYERQQVSFIFTREEITQTNNA